MPKLMRQINMISRIATVYRDDRLKDSDLGACHHTYILTICRNPGISQDKLAQKIFINRSNVTRQLSYLEEKGYVERKQSPTDKRVQLVYPTEKAMEALPFVREIVGDWNDYITEGFSEDELDCLSDMLGRILANAKQHANIKGGDE